MRLRRSLADESAVGRTPSTLAAPRLSLLPCPRALLSVHIATAHFGFLLSRPYCARFGRAPSKKLSLVDDTRIEPVTLPKRRVRLNQMLHQGAARGHLVDVRTGHPCSRERTGKNTKGCTNLFWTHAQTDDRDRPVGRDSGPPRRLGCRVRPPPEVRRRTLGHMQLPDLSDASVCRYLQLLHNPGDLAQARKKLQILILDRGGSIAG